MMEEKRLANHLRDRPAQLEEAKKNGVKVIGYFPGNYVPEEIIYASGGVPLCLAYGGSPRPADAALSVVPHIICPFARAQIGERLLKENPYYTTMIDMLVAPVTCQHLRKVAEIWEYYGDLEIFKLGIPHQHGNDFWLEYFTDRLRVLKDRLQVFTGNEITDERIGNAIELYNRMRELFKKISLIRCTSPSLLSALDFVKLNHASFYADPAFMVDVLDSVYQELKDKKATETNAPRILLLGPNISYGDYRVLELVKAAGGEIVIEDLCEGIRYYWHEIENKGDLLQSLARGYLVDRVPCAFMRYSAKERLDFVLKLIKDFNVSGVIWYELLCCETYDSESYFFAQRLGEHDIPMLILESDYSTAATGQLRTRIDAFIEILKGVTD